MLNKQGLGKIDWTDWTWNPISGCLHGCSYCYIKKMDERFGRGMMKPAIHGDRLKDLRSKKLKPGDKVFVGSSGDMFGDWVDAVYIQDVIDLTEQHSNIIFQFLTKNPKRYFEFEFPENCWLGVTIESSSFECLDRYEKYVDALMDRENIRFVSCEPLLSPLYLKPKMFDWIIIGADSTPGAFRPPFEWGQRLIQNARDCGVPVFVKDNYKGLDKYKEFPCR